MLLIKKWLNGQQNFIVGTGLYKHFGDNPSLHSLLVTGETPFARAALAKALQELHAKAQKKQNSRQTHPLHKCPTVQIRYYKPSTTNGTLFTNG